MTNEEIEYRVVYILLSMAISRSHVLIILRRFDPPNHSIYPGRLGRTKIDGMVASPMVLVELAIEKAVAISPEAQARRSYCTPIVVPAMQAVAYVIEPSIYVSKLD